MDMIVEKRGGREGMAGFYWVRWKPYKDVMADAKERNLSAWQLDGDEEGFLPRSSTKTGCVSS